MFLHGVRAKPTPAEVALHSVAPDLCRSGIGPNQEDEWKGQQLELEANAVELHWTPKSLDGHHSADGVIRFGSTGLFSLFVRNLRDEFASTLE
jgi:hypothetical protein